MQGDAYYTPGRIARRLPELPTMVPIMPPIGGSASKRHPRTHSGTAVDHAVCERADLERALLGLGDTEYLAVAGYYLLDVPLDVVSSDLRLTQAQAGRMIWESVKDMARALGWCDSPLPTGSPDADLDRPHPSAG